MPFICKSGLCCIFSAIENYQYVLTLKKITLKHLDFFVSLEDIYGLGGSIPFKYIGIMPTFSKDCEE